MKLKIGKIKPKKEEKKKGDYYSKLSDEELSEIQDEVEEITEDLVEEIAPITEDIIETEDEELAEEDVKEAVNDLFILDKVGIHTDYITKFTELYPKKNVIYHNLITKHFLVWYIKNAKLSLLNRLNVINEYINPQQQADFLKLIKKRLHEDVEIEKNETGVILETEQEIQMYELILNEKWEKNRTLGILNLDALIEEQSRTNNCDIQQALYNLINVFKLDKKLKKISETEPKLIKALAPKKMTPAEEKANIKHSIAYFHHIEFLVKLMTNKMDFIEETTEEEDNKIEVIINLIENRTAQTKTPKTKKKESNQAVFADIIRDDFLEGRGGQS